MALYYAQNVLQDLLLQAFKTFFIDSFEKILEYIFCLHIFNVKYSRDLNDMKVVVWCGIKNIT